MNNTTIEVAKDLLAKGKQKRAMAVFAEAAKTDSTAFREMADCYTQGLGVAVDNHRALKYRNLARRMEKKQRERIVREARLHHQMQNGFFQADYTHFASARRCAYKMAACRERMDARKDWLIRTNKAQIRQKWQMKTATGMASCHQQCEHVSPKIESAASRVLNSLGRNDVVAGSAFERLVACF